MSTPHPAFTLLREQRVPSLNLTVAEYRHRATGAQHIHLSADNRENVFLVALRTVPHDSTGVAHILEHTALCGSERYPVRDPFFMMTRRSLNTFMNAFTSSDWTAYPFASQNRKDFDNLLGVYLDAVFFAQLDPMDFAQEGWRLEFAEPDNPDSPLLYKGIVYNEMKGAMSSPTATLWQTISEYLYPTSTYHYNSGGDPAQIPQLSYDQLVAFYRSHYHPSNAIFMTYGDIPAAEHQQRFEELALHRFEALDETIAVAPEQRYFSPLRVEAGYALDEGDTANKSHLVMGWLLGKSTNLDEALQANLLSLLLLDNSASPLLKALETTDLASAPSPLCGLDDSQLEMAFVCGLEGTEPERASAIEALILSTLEQVAENGVPAEQMEAALHQLELEQREVGGDGFPYGLQLIMTALTSATHRGDPIALLDLDAALERLRAASAEPDFVPNLVRRLLLDNPHRVRLCLRPEPELTARREQAVAEQLAAIKAALDDSAKQQLVDQAKALAERQQQPSDAEQLPKVTLADVPDELPIPEGNEHSLHGAPLTEYAAGTNGLVYQQMVLELPALTEEQLALLPLYCLCLTEVGLGDADYLSVQQRQARLSGSFTAYAQLRAMADDLGQLRGQLVLSAKALGRNQGELAALMEETLRAARFDETARLRELVAQYRARREQAVTGSGHALAMAAASQGTSVGAALNHRLAGLAGIQAVKTLDTALAEDAQLTRFAAELAGIHQAVLSAPRRFLLIGEDEHLAAYREQLAQHWRTGGGDFQPFSQAFTPAQVDQVWVANTQVHFCARAYPTVAMSHPDAPALTVLGGYLRNGYLHTAIREQGGAYGGGASQDNHTGSFRFFSYRDPRLSETLADFEHSLEWLHRDGHPAEALEEAILGVVSGIDRPSSPAGEAKQAYHAELFGRTAARRRAFRQQVLDVSLADLRRVASTYLRPEQASTAVITHKEGARQRPEARVCTL